MNERKISGVVDRGYRASSHDLAVSGGNAKIHNILVASKQMRLTKMAAEAYRIGMRRFFNNKNIKAPLDDLVESWEVLAQFF